MTKKKKEYDNDSYWTRIDHYFELRWRSVDTRYSAYGERYEVWESGYKWDNVREVKKELSGPRAKALEYTAAIRKELGEEGCDPSLEELIRVIMSIKDDTKDTFSIVE